MYQWEEQNELLKLEAEEKTKIAQKVQEYGENSNFDTILAAGRIPYERVKGKLLEKQVEINYQKEQAEQQKQELLKEIEEWKNQKEAEPVRSKAVQQNRERLKQKGIPFVSFYEVVDFKKDIPEQQKDILENALLEMGILDALIIEKSSMEVIQKQDQEFVDKYLLPETPKFGHNALELFDIVMPEGCEIKTNTVSNILSNILLDKTVDGVYIDEQGNYQIGLLGGKADRFDSAKYIGKEAKKRYKETKILNLQEQVEEKEKIIEECQGRHLALEEKIQQLEQEWKGLPNNEALDEKWNRIKIDTNLLTSIREEIVNKEKQLQEKFDNLKQAKEKVDTATKGIYFTKTLAVFEENLELAKELKDDLYELQRTQHDITSLSEKIQIVEEHLEQITQDLEDMQYNLNQMNRKKKQLEEKKQAMEEMIGTGFEELKEKMAICLKLEKELPERRIEMVKIIQRLETNGENDNEKLIQLEQNVTQLEKKNHILKDILEQELNLKYVIQKQDEIGKTAHQILSQYRKFEEKNRSVSDYFETLSIKYRENMEYLTEYNLSMEEMYVEENREELKDLPEDLKNAYQTRYRKDIIGFLKGRKVNLMVLAEDIKETIEETESLIEEDDRKLFEDILTNTVGRKIRERIYHSKDWVKAMNNLMENLHTSSGLSFSLKWKPKVASDETEVDTAELVEILNSDTSILRKEEIKKVANHFRSKFAKAEERSKEKGNLIPFYNIMKDTLDYRNWFEFEFLFKQGNNAKKQLTNNAFYKLSGGEKAMAMYIPLFAAVYARYESAKLDCPRIISLDEAFAGVDDNNIRDCFRILTELDLEYVINSQVLWGEYDTIPSLAINELISDPANQVVSVIRYHWDGRKKELLI